MRRDRRTLGKRSFPGRLTLEEWLAIEWRGRIRLIWRAQADLLGSFRYCADKRCRRHRMCASDDPETCWRMLRRARRGARNRMVMPKTMNREWARLRSLNHLYVNEEGRVASTEEDAIALAKAINSPRPQGER